jgi:hypothetical protein
MVAWQITGRSLVTSSANRSGPWTGQWSDPDSVLDPAQAMRVNRSGCRLS